MQFAIYGRKSVYSDKSDSVDNQFRMCQSHIEAMYRGKVDSIHTYADEGFTGANTDRPELKALLDDISAGLVDVLVVYQLDRLSRDVRDFANIYSALEAKGVMFISLKDSIDTSTPIGKAMMYVSVTFAQMERETIANRVKDNMRGLAKKGYWCLGQVPTGYRRRRIASGKKNHCTLETDETGAAYVRMVFRDFLEGGVSVQGLQTKYRDSGVKSPRGKFFTKEAIYAILTNPAYCAATPGVYDYWQSKGCNMDAGSPRDKWDGSTGVLVYGRRENAKHSCAMLPRDKWQVCLGLHPPIIPAADWLAVQERFTRNTFSKATRYDAPFLKGVLRCGRCGVLMEVGRHKNKDGTITSSYFCKTRHARGKSACDMAQVKCSPLDRQALEIFQKIQADPDAIMEYVEKEETGTGKKPARNYARETAALEAKINRLTDALSENTDSTAGKYIISQIEKLDANLTALRREKAIKEREERALENKKLTALEKAAAIARQMEAGLDTLTAKEKNNIAREMVTKCTWDGEELFLRF